MHSRVLELMRRAKPRSIAAWFFVCWGAFVVASLVVGTLLISLYSQSTVEQLRRGSAAVARGCEAITARYHFFITGASQAPSLVDPQIVEGLTGVVKIALRDLYGVEGGIWQAEQGSVAYAFPTYEGTGEKTDVPQAEEQSIREIASVAALGGVPFERRQDSRSQALLLH